MVDLLITQVLHQNRLCHLAVNKGKIQGVYPVDENGIPAASTIPPPDGSRRLVDGSNCAVLPAFVNGHTHSAMSLLRGYADDMPLFPWLSEKIWPAEALYEEEDFYWGYRLAFLEMAKTGTAFFSDMYFQPDIGLKALKESGLRGAINRVFLEHPGIDGAAERQACSDWFNHLEKNGLTRFCGLAPHSVYTVSEATLRWIGDFARERDLKVQIHLSETEKENQDCQSARGMSPTAWLDKLEFLGPNLSVAHGLWLSEDDRKRLANQGCAVVYNPASNMKLASGPALNYAALQKEGIPVILGTDSNSSGNNLDMREQMKLASLLQKQHYGDPVRMSAGEIFHCASRTGADFWETGGGLVEEGKTADLMLIRLDRPDMTPCYNLLSNLVYSASGDAVDSLIVNGKVVMEGREVSGEEEILRKARERAARLNREGP